MTVIQHTKLDSLAKPAIASDTRKIFVMLPAYNEAMRLGQLLGKIEQTFLDNGHEYEVIVVDDGSADETAKIADVASREMPVNLVMHKKNQGLAAALNTGLRTAIESAREGDIIISMDADDTHPPKTIDRLIAVLDEGLDVAVASRYQAGARVIGVPWNRIFLAQVASAIFRVLMPLPGIRDYTCGYRAYKYEPLRETIDFYGDEFVSEQGFSCMVDVLLKMRRFKFAMGEVPLILRYDLKEGESKMPVGNTIVKTLKLFLHRRFGGY